PTPTLYAIAHECGVSQRTVTAVLARYGIRYADHIARRCEHVRALSGLRAEAAACHLGVSERTVRTDRARLAGTAAARIGSAAEIGGEVG
ncbi:MAG TPA: hypothetical protein VD948_10790, partial [Rhodothermales bacterium]|nr:hypothetical protein [Rhodothermales bacterium]